jgi:hypothetical protein
MSVDKYLDRTYVPGKYTCHNFASEVWQDLTGNSFGEDLIVFLDKGKTFTGMRRRFIKLDRPKDPCVVLFKPRAGHDNHVGIYLRGRVLHLGELGVKFQTLDCAIIGYRELRFYVCP